MRAGPLTARRARSSARARIVCAEDMPCVRHWHSYLPCRRGAAIPYQPLARKPRGMPLFRMCLPLRARTEARARAVNEETRRHSGEYEEHCGHRHRRHNVFD